MLLALGYYIAQPLWSQTARAAVATATSAPLWSLHERKEQIYTTIKELELDRSQAVSYTHLTLPTSDLV